MEKNLMMIQHVQDAFSYQYNLTLRMIDLEGNPVTQPSRSTSLSHMIQKENSIEIISGITDVSIQDIYPGLKVIVSPIEVMGESKYLLCAGMLIDEESRPYLHEYLDTNMKNPEQWKLSLQEIPNVSKEEKKYLVEKVKIFSSTIRILLESEQKEYKNQQLIASINHITELIEHPFALSTIMSEFMKINRNLDFVGFAQKSYEEEFIISETIGGKEFHSLVGTNFTVGEGFLGYAVATGSIGTWTNISHDPRNVIFIRHNIKPTSLLCFPIYKDDQVIGVFFAGSLKVKNVEQMTIEMGKMITNILSIYITHKEIKQTISQQLQQINAVMEIGHLITRVKDEKKIAYMLVDMGLNIIQGRFAAATFFDIKDPKGEIRIISRGFTANQSEQYGRLLLHEYDRSKNRSSRLEAERIKPSSRKLEWGITVIEFPIHNQEFHGVLSLEMNPTHQEPIAFLSSLALIGAIAIEQAQQELNSDGQYVTFLHQAISQFDEQAFEFSKEFANYVLSFSEYLELPTEEKKHIENACLLAHYDVMFLRKLVPSEVEVLQIIEDYRRLLNEDIEEGQTIGIGGQILALVLHSIKNKKTSMSYIESELQEKFHTFQLRSQVLEQHVVLHEDIQYEIKGLSNREQEVLQLIVQGFNNKQIANSLYISEHTVKNHITNIFQKLGISDRAGVIAYFYKQKINQN